MELENSGVTVWLTGLPSAGKTTISSLLAQSLAGERPVEILDGDEVRLWLSSELGYSAEDRSTNVRRIGRVAELLNRNGVAVLVAAVSPFRVDREAVRLSHVEAGLSFVEVYVHASLETCRKRDVKGLYRQSDTNTLRGLTGVDAPYEEPLAPDVSLRTDELSPLECVSVLQGQVFLRTTSRI